MGSAGTGHIPTAAARQRPTNRHRSVATRRKVVNALWWTACFCCLALVIGPTLWMLIGVLGRALPVFHWSVLVQDSHGSGGGLRNAIVGTAVLGIGVMLVGGTVSVLTGIYLSEFATGRTAIDPARRLRGAVGYPVHRARLRRLSGTRRELRLGLFPGGRGVGAVGGEYSVHHQGH